MAGILTRDQLLEILDLHCGMCGCGSVLEATELLKDLLEVAEMRSNGMYEEADETLADVLSDSSDLGRDITLFWLHSTQLVEHGYTLDSFTITPLGDDVLEAMRDYESAEALWGGDDDEPETVTELVGEPDRSLN